MATNDNQNKKRYYPLRDSYKASLVEITEDQYRALYPEIWATQKREQYHHRCMCPRSKWWLCDAMCQDCKFHAPGDNLYLDSPVISKKGDEVTLMDVLEDPTPSIEDILCDKAELDELFARLNELMPEAVQIGKLRQDGLSDEAIANKIGIKRTTFLSRLKKAKEQLAVNYPDLF